MTPHDKRLSLARLQRLAKRLRRSALLARNGDNTAAGEARALGFEQDAAALLWALHELDPMIETPRQFFAAFDAG